MIDILDLPIGTIFIAPSHIQTLLRIETMKKTNGSLGVRMYTLKGFLDTFSNKQTLSSSQILFTYYQKMKDLLPGLMVYQQAALTSTFLNACKQVLDDIKFWHISFDDLPQKTTAQRELYKILSTLYSIPTIADAQYDALQALQSKCFEHVYIYPEYMSIEDKKINDMLLQNGAHLIKNVNILSEKHFYHAVNKRQEIEACAQYIVTHQLNAEEIHITLADTSSQYLVQQIFERYKIPFTLWNASANTSIMTARALALFQYYLHPDYSHVLNCLDIGLFHTEHVYALREYMELFEHDITTPCEHLSKIDMEDIGHILNRYDIEQLQTLEERSESCRFELMDVLTQIRKPSSYESLFLSILAILEQSIRHIELERPVFIKLRNTMKEIYPFIHEDCDLELALSILENIQISSTPQKIGGVIVHGLTQFIPDYSHHFLIGCTQNMYPNFSVKKGIFDESYYAELPYPSMEERNHFHNEQLFEMLCSSKYLYASYPLGTYDGKAMESALEIEQFMDQKPSHYPLQTNYISYQIPFTLHADTAKQLFVRNNKILGSISAFERYVKCPFSYFLRYGLSLREPMSFTFSDSYIGTLSHFILESLVDMYGKDYANQTWNQVEKLLYKEIECMKHVFINRQKQFDVTRIRLQESITQTIKRLQTLEEHSQLKPWKQEEEFYYDIPLNEQIQLSLHGFIDRIDAIGNTACILDYKSSSKTLSETNVFAALQLQLLTYAIVTRHIHKKDILGTYYISLKNENITQDAGSLSRRKPVTHTPIHKEDSLLQLQKAHRINGWTMRDDIDIFDDEGTHISGVRQNKDGMIKASKVYNLDTIETWFMQMYQHIGNQILNGHIACEPNEEACMFCDYGDICRFKGYFIKKPALIEIDPDALYEKGGKKDANME